MPELATGWIADVTRGPDWLFVRLHSQEDILPSHAELATCIHQLLDQHFLNRLILELNEVDVLRSDLVGELVRLHKRLAARDGIMRLCGVSPDNQAVLKASRLDGRFSVFENRQAAVMGRPTQPR